MANLAIYSSVFDVLSTPDWRVRWATAGRWGGNSSVTLGTEIAVAKDNQKTALVTGSTDGVGRMVAERLAADGFRVLVHGRDAARGAEVVAEITGASGAAEFLQADLGSLAEVRRLAAAVREATGRLDLLVNNAGIGRGLDVAAREVSADGYELRFAVNYLSGFLLTYLLLPLLKQSAPARIVNVSSLGQEAIDLDDVMLTHGYNGMRAYRQSKLAQIMFTFDLARELEGSGVTVNALHPATFMATKMVREFGAPLTTVAQGADAIMQLAASPALEGRSGLFFNSLNEATANEQAYDAEARARLKKLSLDSVGLAP
jgi:NAD(P)-dependent dehydrogenase (short-subunit alcohol dehydrogenase family)